MEVPAITAAHYGESEAYIRNRGGEQLLRRFESLGLEPHVAICRYTQWLQKHLDGDLLQFVSALELEHLHEMGIPLEVN